MKEISIELSDVVDLLRLSGNSIVIHPTGTYNIIEDIVTISYNEHPLSVVKNRIFIINEEFESISVIITLAIIYGFMDYYSPRKLSKFFGNTQNNNNLEMIKCMYGKLYDKSTIPSDEIINSMLDYVLYFSKEWGIFSEDEVVYVQSLEF